MKSKPAVEPIGDNRRAADGSQSQVDLGYQVGDQESSEYNTDLDSSEDEEAVFESKILDDLSTIDYDHVGTESEMEGILAMIWTEDDQEDFGLFFDGEA